ncbi:MAG: cyclase family protein [Flavobacteriales bacterium]|nr:cyclase family protein [Flavobacteriales bacterium]
MDWSKGIDISIPFRTDPTATSAWYVGPIEIDPVRIGDWVGSIKEGGSVNFRNVKLNPHGNGTHTECVGHIAPECYSVNQYLKRWMFKALLITITPEQRGDDLVVTKEQMVSAIGNERPEAVILRTLPNSDCKLALHYSNTNPAYIEASGAAYLAEIGVEHFLLDLPSVDREEDGGALAAHKAFWNYPTNPRMEATITELIYVPDHVKDGSYLLNLQVAPIENDASPSRPVLF